MLIQEMRQKHSLTKMIISGEVYRMKFFLLLCFSCYVVSSVCFISAVQRTAWYAVARATWKRRWGQRWNARTIFKEIEVLTICKICISCLFPCPSCKRANDDARPVRRSYLYNFLGRVKCEWSLHVASDFFPGGCCIHPKLYLKMCPLCDFWPPPAAKSWRQSWL